MTGAGDMDLTFRLLGALAAGAAIGLERTYHGRPAGFRTYALVCIGSAMLIAYAATALSPTDPAAPSRVVQGVMTGVGFLGAGVIFKERLSVHGLTTAASIWATAGLGLLIGAGAWYGAGLSWLAILVTLSMLRWVEDRLPHQVFVHHAFSFDRDAAPNVGDLRSILNEAGFRPGRFSHRLDETTGLLEYHVGAFCFRPDAANDALAARLLALPGVKGFDLSPTDD